MSICLCNLSADTALELVAQKKLEVTPASPDFSSFVADPELAKDALGSLADMLPKPIELLVGSAGRRRSAVDIVSHVWQGSLPKNGILALDEEVYVSSPEFTLLQQSSVVHQASLCQMLGRYLGTWTPMPNEPYGQDERAPLTTLESLQEFLTGMGRIRGIGNLRLAMAYTCEGAASAPETTLQLALCLPPELHGLNLAQPTMNYKVDLSAKAQRLCPHQSIRISMLDLL
ncbi:MAG: hypothetical protein Q4A01_06850 [Coriobacteriales bacterium]|nr:hypothetical protein [Coriobacteriales bacterium]